MGNPKKKVEKSAGTEDLNKDEMEMVTKHSALLSFHTFFKEIFGEDNASLINFSVNECITLDVARKIVKFKDGGQAAKDVADLFERIENSEQTKVIDTPERLIALCELLLLAGETRISSECLWASVVVTLKAKSDEMGIVYGLKVHNAFGRFSDKLAKYMNAANTTKFMEKFAVASSMHSRGFYENEFTPINVRNKIPSIREYLHMLASFKMNEDDINEMKKINFNSIYYGTLS